MPTIAMTVAVPDLTGAARMLFYFARALRERGHEVIVAHGPEPTDAAGILASIIPELRELGVRTVRCPLLRRPFPPFVYNQVAKRIGACDAVVGVNQRDRVVALKVAAMKRIPGVLSIQNQHRFWGPLFVPALKRHYYSQAVRQHGTRLVCSSEITKQEVIELGADPERCTVLINGIDLRSPVTLEQKKEARRQLAITEEKQIFVNVGRLDVQKGQDLLIEAWAKRKDPLPCEELWLVGDITEGNQATRSAAFRDQLKSQVQRLGVSESIRFLGWRNDVPAILAAADYYVHSARWEGYPLAVMEAMAASLPVLMTDCSGHPDKFENGVQGYIAAAGKLESDVNGTLGLTEALNLLREKGTTQRLELATAARVYCEQHFDIRVVGRKFAEIIEAEIASVHPR